MSDVLQKTPLNAVHRASGARMVDFGGWDMPVQYPAGIAAEHMAVRTGVGLFDVSHMGEIEVSGPQALDLLEKLTCNRVANLQDGQAHYTGLLNEQAGFIDDLLVHRVGEGHYFLCVNASNQRKDYEHIAAHAEGDVRVDFVSDRWAQIAVQGPKAVATVQKLTDVELDSIQYYWFAQGVVAGVPGILARTGYTGEDGFGSHARFGGRAGVERRARGGPRRRHPALRPRRAQHAAPGGGHGFAWARDQRDDHAL